jgi:hypothetical protein
LPGVEARIERDALMVTRPALFQFPDMGTIATIIFP